jgi:hypothetical protein
VKLTVLPVGQSRSCGICRSSALYSASTAPLCGALAPDFWRRELLETGNFSTIEKIADAENINPFYVSRLLRMTLLAPEIEEAILAGRQPEGLTMASAMQPFPTEWRCQSFL